MKYFLIFDFIRQNYYDKVFDKSTIMDIAKTINNVNSEKTLRNIIGIFKKNNLIKEVDKGKYIVVDKNIYLYEEDEIELKISKNIKKEYPNLNFVIWNTKVLNEFTLHYVTSNYIIVETEKFAIDWVINLLMMSLSKKYNIVTQDMFNSNRELFDNLENLIIVKTLHSKSPLSSKNKIAIEKIMVDIYVDKLYLAYKGKELERIYENILEKYDIDFLKFTNYAKVKLSNNNEYEKFINILNLPKKYRQ